MQTVLIVLHLMIVIALVAIVLLQRSEGGALGVGGGGGFMTGRGQANALTRATAILGTAFFVTSIALTLVAHYNRAPRSALDGVSTAPRGQTQTGAPTPVPVKPGSTVLEQIQEIERQKAGAASAAPAQPEVPKSQ